MLPVRSRGIWGEKASAPVEWNSFMTTTTKGASEHSAGVSSRGAVCSEGRLWGGFVCRGRRGGPLTFPKLD